jgi:hypothetical protein
VQHSTAHPLIFTDTVVYDTVRLGWVALISIILTHHISLYPSEHEIGPCHFEDFEFHRVSIFPRFQNLDGF